MSLSRLGWALCLGLSVFAGGCGEDATGSADSGVDGSGGSPDASMTGGAIGTEACACTADTCNAAGRCLCDQGEAVCLCDAGYAGRACDSCQPGYTLSGERRRLQLSRVQSEPSGDACEAGGVAILEGVDDDGNGRLDSA